MPIHSIHSRPHKTVASTPEEIDADVNAIMANLGTTHRDFVHASETYNSDFFNGEPFEFQNALARALIARFPSYSNNYWTKLAATPGTV